MGLFKRDNLVEKEIVKNLENKYNLASSDILTLINKNLENNNFYVFGVVLMLDLNDIYAKAAFPDIRDGDAAKCIITQYDCTKKKKINIKALSQLFIDSFQQYLIDELNLKVVSTKIEVYMDKISKVYFKIIK